MMNCKSCGAKLKKLPDLKAHYRENPSHHPKYVQPAVEIVNPTVSVFDEVESLRNRIEDEIQTLAIEIRAAEDHARELMQRKDQLLVLESMLKGASPSADLTRVA